MLNTVIFDHSKKIELHMNVRAENDNTRFAGWLLRLGDSNLKDIPGNNGSIVIPISPDFLAGNKYALITKVTIQST